MTTNKRKKEILRGLFRTIILETNKG